MQFLKKEGIVHQKTNPHTPQQNSMSERMNTTFIEKARCLLFETGLSQCFWAEAVNKAIYFKNRCIAKGLEIKTPSKLGIKKGQILATSEYLGVKLWSTF